MSREKRLDDVGCDKMIAETMTRFLAACETLVQLQERVTALEKLQDNLGDVSVRSLALATMPTVIDGTPLFQIGSGAPTDFPRMVGQFYYDKTNSYLYVAVTLTGSSSDWKKV